MTATAEEPQIDGALWVKKKGKLECVYQPQPHQQKFHSSTTKNCIMEGGAGSGKSIAMRFDAYMRCLRIPRFRALILRRSMPELRMSHLDNVPYDVERMGLPREAWHSTTFTLRFPNGSVLVFGHVEDDATVARFLSSEWDAIYFDELTTFTLKQFLFLKSRARSTKVFGSKRLQPIIRGGTNPVGPGASWVRRYFITKDITQRESPGYDPADYEAQKSTVDDNKYVDVNDYEKELMQLPSEAMRRAMRYGEWVIEGQFFSEWREGQPVHNQAGELVKVIPWHVIDEIPRYKGRPIIEYDWAEIVRVVDWGYAEEGNPGLCQWYVILPGTPSCAVMFQEYLFKKTLPGDVAKEIIRRSEGMKVRYTVGDTAMWQEHEGPSIAELMAIEGLGMVEADKEREPGWINVHKWLREVYDDGVIQRPRIQVLRSCEHTVRTIPAMVVDPKNPADMETKGVEDEAADDMRYFVMSRPGATREREHDPRLDWIKKELAKIRRGQGTRLGSEAKRRAS